MHFAFASYQPFIDTALILLCGGAIVLIIDNRGDIATSLYQSRFIFLSVIISAISYKVAFDALKSLGVIIPYYNTQMLPIAEMPERIVSVATTAFSNLVAFDMPFMPLGLTLLFVWFLVAFAVLLSVSSLNIRAKCAIVLIFLVAILSSQAHNVLSHTPSNYDGVHFYGLLFLRVLAVALCFKLCAGMSGDSRLVQNALFVLSVIVIWVCVAQDLRAQKVQKLAFDAEFRLLNRIAARIEQSAEFSYNRQYCGIMFGEMPNMRMKLYERHNTSDSVALLKQTLIAPWNPKGAFDAAMAHNVFDSCGFYHANDYDSDEMVRTLIARLHKAGILARLQPYPHSDSIAVFENIIVFVASDGNLIALQKEMSSL